jgi:hypothetical protein
MTPNIVMTTATRMTMATARPAVPEMIKDAAMPADILPWRKDS